MNVDEIAAGALELGVYELLRQRLVKTVLVASPAAGADWSATVPPGEAWELLAVLGVLTTSAAVANRGARLQLTDGTTKWFDSAAPNTQAATLARNWEWHAGIGFNVAAGGQLVQGLPDPPPVLPAGSVVKSVTDNVDAGDQWSAVALQVRAWSLVAVAAAGQWYARKRWPM